MSFPILPEISLPRQRSLTWWSQTACADVDPEVFFPHQGDEEAFEEAQKICHRCPVIAECREYAENLNAGFGVWAGSHATTIQRRKRVRRALGQ